MTIWTSVVGRARRVPLLVGAGAGSGTLAGLAAGVMLSSGAGIVIGTLLGAALGTVAGIVMDGDDKRAQRRTRELDDIIGVTSGSLGAPPSLPPPNSERDQELASWVTEWMTPPAPRVG